MSSYVIQAPAQPSLAVADSELRFPIRRVFCVGRNYAAHAREMGSDPNREPPFFFTKPADAVVPASGAVPYPSATQDLHHEVELVVALGAGGADVDPAQALDLVWGYGVGLDLTRRDLQGPAKAKGLPWDTGKGFDHSAPVSELVPATGIGALEDRTLTLRVNGDIRQHGALRDLIWDVPDILHELSRLYALKAGDLVFMGTPAGVAALLPGDVFLAALDGVVELGGRITA